MSEEEIIGNINWAIHVNKMTKSINGDNTHISVNVLQGLLNLYIAEKEKNKKIEDKIKGKINNLEIFRKTLPIRATEIERFIGELKDLLEE